MNNILQTVENHAGLILIILLAVLVIEMMVKLFENSGNRERGSHKGMGDEEKYFREIGNNSQTIQILVKTQDKCVVYVSENVESILGLKAEDIMADIRALEKVTSRKYIRQMEDKLDKWDRTGPLYMEAAYKIGDQKRRGLINIALTEDEEYYLWTLSDITLEYNRQQEMEEEIEKANRNDQSKTRYLSKMSHEIRTPMNGMLGMISLARLNMEQREEAEDYLVKAEGLSQFLLSIINDVLDMSRIESGKIELANERVDIFALAEKLKNMFQITVEDKGVRFVMEMQDFTIRYVMGDELRISQVMTNFLSNASKFTPAGGQITVTFRQMHVFEDKVNLMMRVRDTGKGMSPEFMSRIFNPFEQEDAGVAKNYGGSGLGMAISDNLVQLMGGHITVDSEPEKGSDFTVFLELPIAQGDQTLPDKEKKNLVNDEDAKDFSLEGFRILLAEDNKINAIIATKLLHAQGAVIENAVNGLEALHMFQNKGPDYYQLILMDIQMPELNGWEATQAIRALNRPDAQKIPILALSADAFVEDKRKSIAMGMNGHVAKPIDFEELKKVIQRVM
ncbi:MAG: ATP-binding protein [Lachnospiraceae bacterium]|nr:ATP-binding protein [Lachnospiraceae bacterium]MDD3614662.1 ATP-binding protein [Lachnospiraceae bacterium]